MPEASNSWQFGVAVGRAYELLRADVRAHLQLCRERIGFRYCRFHGLFHDDMLVALRDPEGRLHFQWNQVDRVLEFLLSIGMKPFLELGPMPGVMASGSTTFFWWKMNVTPPLRFAEWESLVEAFVRHCVRRYGVDEVRSWYFEVWNEPNLRAFWDGTWEQYVELYARSAQAVKRVDAEFQVGGPASAEAKKVPEFLADCHQRGIPVDFVSTHVYPQNEWNHFPSASPHRSGEFFGATVRDVRRQVRESPYPIAPIFWTEYNALSARTPEEVEWVDNSTIDRLETAAFIVRQAIELDSESDGMVWWVASDVFEEAGIAQSPFSCTYGLVTVDGIPKASFRAFELLARFRGERKSLEHSFPPACGAAAAQDGEILRVLAWNDAAVAEPRPWSESLQVPWGGQAVLTRATIRRETGSAFEAWEAAGRPHELTPFQLEAVQAASAPSQAIETLSAKDGFAAISIDLAPGEAALYELAPPSEAAHGRAFYSENVAGWNAALGEAGSG